jgi:hypothetical protein
MLAKGKSNMFKTFPSINLKTLPKLQQEHMNTTPTEKRDILKRKAEEEERARRAKEEEKRLAEEARFRAQQEKEKEEQARRTAIAQKAEQAKIEAEKVERQRLAKIEAARQEQLELKRNVIRGQIANKDKECEKLRERISDAERRGIIHGTGGTAHLQNLLRVRIDKRNVLKQKLENVR